MGSLYEDDDEEFDLAAVEARHEELEALEALDTREGQLALDIPGCQNITDEKNPDGIYPESDWEAIVEAVLFTMGNSVELRQLAAAIDQSENVARRVVTSLQKRYQKENRGMQIIELENAYQMCTRAEYYENLIRVASAPKKHVLTDVVLETLSIIAYKQPVTKMEISKIRGVSSDHAVNRLVEYGLVYEAGRLDAPGRPALFATTEEFLRRFGVGSTTDLPTMNPEQEEEIRQEVEEELQMKLNEMGALENGNEDDALDLEEAVERAMEEETQDAEERPQDMAEGDAEAENQEILREDKEEDA